MRLLESGEVTTDFGEGILQIRAAVSDGGQHAVASVLRKAAGGSHPATIGQLHGCGMIVSRHRADLFANAIKRTNDECAHFAIPVQKSHDGLYSLMADASIGECDHAWVPDDDAKDTVRRIVMDKLRSSFGFDEEINVFFDDLAKGYRYNIGANGCASNPFVTHNQAYVAGSMRSLANHGVAIDAPEIGRVIKQMIDSTLRLYATDVIIEYNDWLAGEAYEVSQAEFNAADPSLAPTRVGTPLVVVGRVYADILLNNSFDDISRRMTDAHDAEDVAQPSPGM